MEDRRNKDNPSYEMNKLELEICEQVSQDTLTREITQRSVYVKSGMRHIFLGITTIIEINDYLKKKGVRITSND